MKSVLDVEIKRGDLVLLRSSLNIPLTKENTPVDMFRVNESLRTIEYLMEKRAKVVVIAHLGREKRSLKPIADILNTFIKVKFLDKLVGEEVEEAKADLKQGEVLLLENTRIDGRETKGDVGLAEALAKDIDLFVFDAFDAAHREHTSTYTLIKYMKNKVVFGIRFCEEIERLSSLLENKKEPSLAILAGSKLRTKLPLLNLLLKEYSKVFIGGVLLNTILRAKGLRVGHSVCEDMKIDETLLNDKNLLIPGDVVVKTKGGKITKKITDIKQDEMIVDVGENSIIELNHILNTFKTIIWNGPLGLYEENFTHQTLILSKLIGDIDAYKVLAGGDTTSLIFFEKQEKNWSYVSTGGGSFLYYLLNKTLPSLEAVNPDQP